MKTKIHKYTRLLGLSFLLSLLPSGLLGQTLPITHIDRPDVVNHVNTSGSSVYSSANASGGVTPSNPLYLGTAPNSQYQWSFSFQIPEDRFGRPVIIRLDDGSASAGHFIAGISINTSGQLGYLTNPNTGTLSSQMTYLTDGPALEENVWYDVTFLITTPMVGENMGISYVLSIPGIIDEGIVVNYVPSELNDATAVRHLLSFQSGNGGTDLNVSNVSLQTIPEPATWAAMFAIGGILIALRLRKRSRG